MKALAAKFELTVSTAYVLPAMLAVNTAALFALNAAGVIPAWVKTAASLFLSF